MVVAFGLNSEPDVIPDLMGNLTYVAHLFLSLVGFIRRQLYQFLHLPVSSAVPSLRGLPIAFGKSCIS